MNDTFLWLCGCGCCNVRPKLLFDNITESFVFDSGSDYDFCDRCNGLVKFIY